MPVEFGDDDVTRLRMALGRVVRGLDRRTNEQDLTRTQLIVLGTIARTKRIALAELAEFEGINPTMLSRIVGKLEDLGHVRRVPDEQDRRVAHAEITPSGEAVWQRHRQVRSTLLAKLLSDLPQNEAASLLAAIPALEALAAIARPSPPREDEP